MVATVNRILFISLSNIGDTILTTPVLQTLHELYPEAKIDIVSDNRSKIIYEHCPYRGEIFIKNKKSIFRGSLSLTFELRKKYYDLIVDLRTELLAYFLKGKKRLTKWHASPYGPHAVEEHMGVIRKINTESVMQSTKIWLTDELINNAKEYLKEIQSNRILAIAPGCHVPVKVWSPQNYASLCNELSQEIDAVVILGSESDKPYALELTKSLSVPFKDLTGQTNILQAAAVLNQAFFFVGNDSGLGHIASAVAVPSMTLFGIGEPQRYHPWGDRAIWLCGNNKNINTISVDDAVSAVKKHITKFKFN